VQTSTYSTVRRVNPRRAQPELGACFISFSSVGDATRRWWQVKLLSHMSHPFVLGYIDSFIHNNCMCIVTEYCDGGDLYTLLKVRVRVRVYVCVPLACVHQRTTGDQQTWKLACMHHVTRVGRDTGPPGAHSADKKTAYTAMAMSRASGT
jgi:hypothetical protein